MVSNPVHGDGQFLLSKRCVRCYFFFFLPDRRKEDAFLLFDVSLIESTNPTMTN
jgi:hypothetical protein